MAYNKQSVQDVASYMDGVPVKISEKFRPPRKVTLPVGFMNRIEATLENTLQDMTYDFSLAKSVAETNDYRSRHKSLIRRERRSRIDEAEQLQRAERDKEFTKQLERINLKMESVESESMKATVPSSPTSPPAQPVATVSAAAKIHTQAIVMAAPQYSTILTPMPASAKNSSSNSHPKSTFNFSDFENDTSSPFDNVELKTINDLEELAHVLQPEAKCNSASTPATYQYSNLKNNNLYHGPQDQSSRESQLPNSPTSNMSATYYQQPGSSYHYPQQQQAWAYAQQHFNYCAYPTSSADSQLTYQAISGAPLYSQASDVRYAVKFSNSAAADSGMQRSSKSVPDIMEELQKEADASKSSRSTAMQVPKVEAFKIDQFSTTRPASFGSAGLENWKPWPDLDSPADTPSEECSPPPLVTRPTPNPFDQLLPSAQRQAKQISEMGFPVAKVVRACKLVGEDHKQVVDFLLRVQALEEKGFPDSRVEYVLGTLKMDEEKAHQFLPVFVQLVDLGFTEDKVSEALLQAGCDRDKALDVLLS